MITACTVILEKFNFLIENIVNTLLRKAALVSEIVVIVITEQAEFKNRVVDYKVNGIVIREISLYLRLENFCYGHALGLHKAIDQATNDYLLLTDPDIVYYLNGFDKFYLDAHQKYSLTIIGASHYDDRQAYGQFPTVISSLVKKSTLPDKTYLKGYLKFRSSVYINESENEAACREAPGMYLLQSPIPMFISRFPNSKGIFDVGCNLWLWNQDLQGRYLVFDHTKIAQDSIFYIQTLNTRFANCSTGKFLANFSLDTKFDNVPIFYHSKMVSLQPDLTKAVLNKQYGISEECIYYEGQF